MEEDTIRRQLLEDNAYFKSILDLIPPQFYFDHDTKRKLRGDGEEDEEQEDVGPRKRKVKTQPGEMSDRAMWKRKKFDPSHIKTVTEIQRELIEGEKLEKSRDKSQRKIIEERVKSSGGSPENLREKLEEKINNLRAKRKAPDGNDYLEKKRLKRRESKMKLKLRQKSEKQRNVKETMTTTGKSPSGKPLTKKPIYNQEGKMVFSKFDFSNSGTKERPNNALTGKNYKALLEKVKKQKDKVVKLKETSESAAKAFQEKTQWKTVLQKAEGAKVKDNPELLKKAIKRKEKKKEKSKKNWDEREKHVKETMKSRQEKRKGNIQKKKKAHTDKKIQKAKKKGRILPGF